MQASVRTVLMVVPFAFVFCEEMHADEVCLKSGRCLQGDITERSTTSVTIDISPGRITLPMAVIERVEVKQSALATYRRRLRTLDRNDAQGWLALGLWAKEHDLNTQAETALNHVLSLDPSNREANEALNKVLLGDQWMSQDEAYRAKGYVRFEGAWIPREERDALIEQRRIETEAAATAAMRAEAEARRAEAEARARQAEAQAEQASESQANQPTSDGIPLGWGIGAPCIGAGCVTTPVQCGPNMSGPACQSTEQSKDKVKKSHREKTQATPAPTPAPTPAHSSKPRPRAFPGKTTTH
jgi:hypothetical protein